MSIKEKKKVRATSAAKQLNVNVQQILDWAGRSNDRSGILVSMSEMTAAKINAERISLDAAASSNNPRVARAGKKRQSRSGVRVELDFSLSPEDRATLVEVQSWVDEWRQKFIGYVIPKDWRPEKKKTGDEPGTISYLTPSGWVSNIPADDYRRMMNGDLEWAMPNPKPPMADIRKMAKKLESLDFQADDCRLCGEPLEEGTGPELAQIHQLLDGRFVLPFIKHSLEPHQKEMRFRRMHLLCSVWEERLAQVMISLDEATTDDVVTALNEAIPMVAAEARKRRPTITERDVYECLDMVLATWEKEA